MTETIDLSKPKSHLKEWDRGGLWEKRTYTDLTTGEIVMLEPVLIGGRPDPMRLPKFYSSVIAVRSGQQMNVSFEIEGATTLEEALDKWLGVAEEKAAEFHRKAEEAALRRSLGGVGAGRMTELN